MDTDKNFGTFTSTERNHGLSIVDYSDVQGIEGRPLGMGIRTDVERENGDMLGICVFGEIMTKAQDMEAAKEKGEPVDDFPAIPGVFALQKPYEETVIVIADNCPARYVNDARGVPGATCNIQFLQHPNPKSLYYDHTKGLQMLVQAQAIRHIEAGEQLFVSYGKMFWEKAYPIGRQELDYESILDTTEITEIKDEERVFESIRTPMSDNQLKAINASTLSQGTPLSPVSLDFKTPDLNTYPSSPPISNPSRAKKVTKSGGGKDIDLDDMPQALTPIMSQGKKPRKPRQSKKRVASDLDEMSEETKEAIRTRGGKDIIDLDDMPQALSPILSQGKKPRKPRQSKKRVASDLDDVSEETKEAIRALIAVEEQKK